MTPNILKIIFIYLDQISKAKIYQLNINLKDQTIYQTKEKMLSFSSYLIIFMEIVPMTRVN